MGEKYYHLFEFPEGVPEEDVSSLIRLHEAGDWVSLRKGMNQELQRQLQVQGVPPSYLPQFSFVFQNQNLPSVGFVSSTRTRLGSVFVVNHPPWCMVSNPDGVGKDLDGFVLWTRLAELYLKESLPSWVTEVELPCHSFCSSLNDVVNCPSGCRGRQVLRKFLMKGQDEDSFVIDQVVRSHPLKTPPNQVLKKNSEI